MSVKHPRLVVAAALFALGCSSDAPAPEAEAETAMPELHCATSADAAALAERASPLDSLSFTLSNGPAKLCYGRPSARGRVIVGELDPFDAPWRMGANEPTTLHLAAPASVGGVDVDAGSYALYAIPAAEGPWTIVLNGNPDRWGIPITDEVRAADIGSFEVTPTMLEEPVETLTFAFQAEEGAGQLVFSFEGRSFSFPVTSR